MAEPKVGMMLELPGKPPIDKGERTKQRLPDRPQDQAAKADTVLTEKVRQALGADHLLRRGDVAHMRVMVKGGIATLTGHVEQSINKARAEAAAREAPGVVEVVNHLVVDNELMMDVAQALGYDQQTQDEQIQVNVQRGVVYLAGIVTRAPVRTAAATVAASIPHARGIINVIQTPGIGLETEEERFVQPLIESEIYATDGKVGRVQQVIINPQNRRVTAVMVHTSAATPQATDWADVPAEPMQLGRPILIPISSIRRAPSGALFLTINSNEAAHFATFDLHNFGPPPADWQPPYPYWPADVLFHRYRSRKESL
jgi:osmotically-inducible protein OsmY/sporulation protein YlmC with PRC-barrel domain